MSDFRPGAYCRANPAALVVELPAGDWRASRELFYLVADTLKEKAWELSEAGKDGAATLEAVADAIAHAVAAADAEVAPEGKKEKGA